MKTFFNYKPDKDLILKLILFFCLGLFLQWFGLVIGLIWIWVKSKINKRLKVAVLLTGFLITQLWYLMPANNYLAQKFYQKYPEVNSVNQSLQNKFIDHNPHVTKVGKAGELGSNWQNFIEVTYTGTNLTQDIGKSTCTILKDLGSTYKQLTVVQVLKRNLIYQMHNTETKSCDQWLLET